MRCVRFCWSVAFVCGGIVGSSVAFAQQANPPAPAPPEFKPPVVIVPAVTVIQPEPKVVTAPSGGKPKGARPVDSASPPPAAPKPTKTTKAPVSTPAPGPANNPSASVSEPVEGSPTAAETSSLATGSSPSTARLPSGSTRIVEQVTNVSEVTAREIEQAGARTLDEAVKLVPGVYVRTAADGVPRIDIRGLRTRNIQLLVDGVPLNNSFDGQFDPRAIPIENVARIKVIQGGGSVLYGAGGNAAVIDIITKSAEKGLHGSAEVEYGVGRNSIREKGTLSYGSEAVKVFLAASALDQDKWELSDKFTKTALQNSFDRVNSDRTDRALYGNIAFEPNPDSRFGVSVGYRNGEYGKPPSTVAQGNTGLGIFARRTRFERMDDFESWNVQAAGSQKIAPGITIKPSLFYSELSELTNGYDNANFTTQAAANAFRENAQTTIYGGGLQTAFNFGAGNLLTVSANAQNDSWQSSGFSVVTVGTGRNARIVSNPIAADRDVQSYSLAAEQELKLTRAWSAVAGIGYVGQDRDSTSSTDYTYLVGTRYALNDQTAVRGSVARKVRFPTLRDLYSIGSGGQGGAGNPNLRAEVTQNYEVGIDYQMPAQKMMIGLAVYRTESTDFIEADVNQVFQNFARYKFQGYEVTWRYNGIQNLDVAAGYMLLDAKNESPGADTSALQARPRHKVNVALDYRLGFGTALHADYLFSGGSRDLSRTAPT
jgi:vitamin B12 transporter